MKMNEIGPETRVKRRETVPWQTFEEGGILLDVDCGEYFEVDEVGLYVWEQLDGKPSLLEVAECLMGKYGISRAVALRDVTEFVKKLQRYEVSEVVNEPPAVESA